MARLYKYLVPERIDVLANRRIRFTQASCFNDPFELFPTLDSYLRPLMTAISKEQAKAGHNARQLAHPKGDEDRRSWLIRQLPLAMRGAGHRMSSDERRAFLSTARNHLNESFGVLSVAGTADNILMWSHYARSHTGFVLELDATDAFFDQRTFPSDPLRCVRSVRYQAGRPDRALFDQKYWLRSKNRASNDLLEYMAGLLLLTKSNDWAYEREWRMIVPFSTADQVIPHPTGDVHLLPLPARCIRGVILGSRMADSDRDRVADVLKDDDYMHVELRHADRDPRRFRVVIRDDDSVLETNLLADVAAFPADGIQERIGRLNVRGPLFYAAERALAQRGLITAERHDRSKQKKRHLGITAAGQSVLAARTTRVPAPEKTRESAEDGLLVEAVLAAPDRMEELIEDWWRERLLEPVPENEETDPRAMDLFRALSHPDERTHWAAAHSLRLIGDVHIVEPLISILGSRHNEPLVWLQDPIEAAKLEQDEIDEIEAEAPLAYWLLSDRSFWGSDELTSLAAYALAGIAARIAIADEAVDPLIEALKDPCEDVRRYAAEALGQLGSARALSALQRLVEKEARRMRAVLARARGAAGTDLKAVAQAARTAIQQVKRAQKRGSRTS